MSVNEEPAESVAKLRRSVSAMLEGEGAKWDGLQLEASRSNLFQREADCGLTVGFVEEMSHVDDCDQASSKPPLLDGSELYSRYAVHSAALLTYLDRFRWYSYDVLTPNE